LRKVRAAEDEQDSPSFPSRKGGGTNPATWYVLCLDDAGDQRKISGSTDELRLWLRQGWLDAEQARVSKHPQGPFEPLEEFEEWSGTATSTLPHRRAPRAAVRLGGARAIPAVAKGENASAGKPESERGVWTFPIVAAMVAAMVLGWFLFR
jgi:hypothetical protein